MAPWLWAVVALGAAALVLLAVAWWFVRRQSAEARALAGRVGRLPWRAKARLAWGLLRDRRVPLWVRVVIPALFLYLAMPLDFIPDFIPVVGHLDDVLAVAIAVGLVLRFTPRAVLEEHLTVLETSSAHAP